MVNMNRLKPNHNHVEPLNASMKANKITSGSAWGKRDNKAFLQDYKIRHDLHVNPENLVIL